MKDFCIVGSGISGATIAKLLSKKYTIKVYDKARGPGGRSANRRYKDNLSFDHGLQYISPKTAKFKKFILNLKKNNVLKVWEKNHFNLSLDNTDLSKRYIGKKSNNDISKFLLKDIDTSYDNTIKKLVFKKNYWLVINKLNKEEMFRNVILTCPYPQAKKLIKKYMNKSLSDLKIKMQPNITVMLVYKNKNQNKKISSFKLNNKIIAFAANENSKKRFVSNLDLWTLQSTLNFAVKNINKYKNRKKSITNLMIKEFEKVLKFTKTSLIFKDIHGWKYSYHYEATKIKSFWSKKYSLGICGDWFLGPKAEHAWTSSNNLYSKIIQTKKNPLNK